MKFQTVLAAMLSALLFSNPVSARWPDRPVRMIIPVPPGGALDKVARAVGDRLAASLMQPFVAEFRPGRTGLNAAEFVAQAPADGYTLLISTSEFMTVVPHTLGAKSAALNQLTPLAELARSSLILVGNPSLPATNLRELVGHVKAHPGIPYASYGRGSYAHLAGLMLNQRAGMKMRHVGYQGSPAAVAGLMQGKVALMFDGLVNAVTPVREGKLKAFAISAGERSAYLPAVPTFRELGYPDLVVTGWIGVFASSRLAPEAIARINLESSLRARHRAGAALASKIQIDLR